MHPTEINRIRNEIRRLVLAAADMRLAADGARALARNSSSPHARLIEIGVFVAYCRSFSGPPRPGLEPRTEVDTLAPENSTLHGIIFRVRSKLFAHTDDDYVYRREARDPFGEHSHSEEYSDLNPDFLEELSRLADGNRERFIAAQREREQALRDAGVPPGPY